MVKQVVRISALLAGWMFAACSGGPDDDIARVTIDVRCSSNADCPRGFACEADAEHGPPTTMCQSSDPGLSCPRGFDTHVGYSQTFCKLHVGVGSRKALPSSIPVRGHRASRGGSHGGQGL